MTVLEDVTTGDKKVRQAIWRGVGACFIDSVFLRYPYLMSFLFIHSYSWALNYG